MDLVYDGLSFCLIGSRKKKYKPHSSRIEHLTFLASPAPVLFGSMCGHFQMTEMAKEIYTEMEEVVAKLNLNDNGP